jgi:hypothetical protein
MKSNYCIFLNVRKFVKIKQKQNHFKQTNKQTQTVHSPIHHCMNNIIFYKEAFSLLFHIQDITELIHYFFRSHKLCDDAYCEDCCEIQ